MDEKIEIALKKAYRGWDVPAYLYDRQREIVAAGQRIRTLLPRSLIEKLWSYMEQHEKPAVYFADQNVIYLLFWIGESLAVLGPAAIRQIGEEQWKKILFEHLRTEGEFSIPYVPLRRAASCLSTVCYIATGECYEEDAILDLVNDAEEQTDADIIQNYIWKTGEQGEERYQYSDEERWLAAIERGELHRVETSPSTIYDNLYRVGTFADNDDMKQGEYMMLSAIVLASRAAIRGGADPYKVYQISDQYLKKLSSCKTLFEIRNTGTSAVETFTMLVRQHLESADKNVNCERAKNYIARHIKEKIKVGQIAENVGISSRHLAKLFMEEEGMSINHYIMRERLKLAANLLRNTDESMGTISDYLAFHSQSYFASHFREEFGMTPTEYRQKNKKFVF